jgi:hypothetical protein
VRVHGRAGLECAVEDAAGTVRAGVVDSTGACGLRWTPAQTGNYRVLVRNPVAGAAPYRLTIDHPRLDFSRPSGY